MATPIVQLGDIRKRYQMGLVTVEALRWVSFGIAAGEYISIMGQPKLAPLVRELSWTQNLRILPAMEPDRHKVEIGDLTNEFIEIKRGVEDGEPGL